MPGCFHGLLAPRVGSAQQWEYTLSSLRGGAASAWLGDQARATQVRTQPWPGNGPHSGMGLMGSEALLPRERVGGGQHHSLWSASPGGPSFCGYPPFTLLSKETRDTILYQVIINLFEAKPSASPGGCAGTFLLLSPCHHQR